MRRWLADGCWPHHGRNFSSGMALSEWRLDASSGGQVRVLTGADTGLHALYCSYVRSVFSRADFAAWIGFGDWDANYRAFSILEQDRIVANAALTRMRLILDGEEQLAWQMGAVGVLPEARGRGLARIVISAALDACSDAPVFLFANPKVRQFYPRFGFVARQEHVFTHAFACRPAGANGQSERAPELDLTAKGSRDMIQRLSEHGLPTSKRFAARGYGGTIRWYLDNRLLAPPRIVADDCLVFAQQRGDCLYIQDILSMRQFDLAACIPSLIEQPMTHLRFGFTPDVWWPSARAVRVDPEPDLYLRGMQTRGKHKFPVLAQT